MWFRINYSIPSETTVSPLMIKVIAADEATARIEYSMIHPSRIIHSVQPIGPDEVKLIELVSTCTN